MVVNGDDDDNDSLKFMAMDIPLYQHYVVHFPLSDVSLYVTVEVNNPVIINSNLNLKYKLYIITGYCL
jgi:hypothetical protein